jgi:hypothetical protein
MDAFLFIVDLDRQFSQFRDLIPSNFGKRIQGFQGPRKGFPQFLKFFSAFSYVLSPPPKAVSSLENRSHFKIWILVSDQGGRKFSRFAGLPV